MQDMNNCGCGSKTIKIKNTAGGDYLCQCHHCKREAGAGGNIDEAISNWNTSNPVAKEAPKMSHQEEVIRVSREERGTPKVTVATQRNNGDISPATTEAQSSPERVFNPENNQIETQGPPQLDPSNLAPFHDDLTPSKVFGPEKEVPVPAKKRGRPRGSTNKPKVEVTLNQPVLPATPTPANVNVTITKRGRPAGSKNKPKEAPVQ